MLRMLDVQAVQLRARLVVLSCCDSAQGKITPEGVVGFGRAILGAGVALGKLMTKPLWEFMKSFYRHLARGHSASVALNCAMKYPRESRSFVP